jgi:hypothetical protein
MQAGQLVFADDHLRPEGIEIGQWPQQLEVERLSHLAIPTPLTRHKPLADGVVAARLKCLKQRNQVFSLWRYRHPAIVP